VNEYIARQAADALEARVLAACPRFAPALERQRRRLLREFALKQEIGQAAHWYGWRRCLRDPRAVRSLLHLWAIRVLWGGPFDGWLRRHQFVRDGLNAEATSRVRQLLDVRKT
jgi:hypothetical protein